MSAPYDPLSKKVRTIDDWLNLTDEEAKKLSNEDTLRWLHACEVHQEREDKRRRIKSLGYGAAGMIGAACYFAMVLALGLAGLVVGLEVISLLLAALQNKPFILKGQGLENLQWGVVVLVIVGPLAYVTDKFLDPH